LVFITFVGVWGAVYIASRAEVNKVITLVYVTIIILLSSLLLPPRITIVLALSHYIAVLIMVLSEPDMIPFNQVNILIYIFLASLFSVVSNYVISYQSRQFRQNAIKDHLTQLFNRRYFDETLDTLITRGSSKNETFGVILADIDNFKNYNDKFGHAVGDSALQLVANFLSTEVGLHNIVCRYGGDEFVILVPNATDKELIQLAERLNINVKQVDCSLENVKAPKITISMGLALFPHNGFTGEQLVFHADSQLLRAKEGGKDTIAFDHFGSTI
jgi:diguanylate cyclase (GGDEF)-like protein